MPPEPDLSVAQLDLLKRWAEGLRELNESIRSAKLWEFTSDCQKCRDEGVRPPAEGCDRHHPFADWEPSAWQTRLWYIDDADMVVHTAGSGAGKSYAAGRLLKWYLTNTLPDWFLEDERIPFLSLLARHRSDAPYLVWICGQKRESISGEGKNGPVKYLVDCLKGTPWLSRNQKDGSYPGIHSVAHQKGGRITTRIELLNGNIAEVRVVDDGKAAFESTGVAVAWEDEEFEGKEGDNCRAALYARLGRKRGRVYSVMTAIDTAVRGGDSWLARNIIKPGMAGGFNKDLNLKIQVGRSSTWENTKQTFEQRLQHDAMNRDPATGEKGPWYRVRVEGYAEGVNVSAVLLQSSLEYLLGRARDPLRVGRLVDSGTWVKRGKREDMPGWTGRPVGALSPSFVEDPQGALRIFEDADPSCDYVIGGDAGGGVQAGGHSSSAVVYNRTRGSVAATMMMIRGPHEFALELILLGWYFNEAWICMALGGPGLACVQTLAGAGVGRRRYEKLYRNTSGARDEGRTDTNVLGFTEGAGAPDRWLSMINKYLEPRTPGDLETVLIDLVDAELIRQCLSIRRDISPGGNSKLVLPENTFGHLTTHCDLATSLGMALIAHESPSCRLQVRKRPPTPRLEDPKAEAIRRDLRRGAEKAEAAKKRRGSGLKQRGRASALGSSRLRRRRH